MRPTLDEFLVAPASEISTYAPETAVFAAANARRIAALNGVPPESFLEWITEQMAQVVPRFFRSGFQHLIVPTLGGTQLDEAMTGYGYGSRVIDWIEYYSSSEESALVKSSNEQGFRIRLMGPAVKTIQRLGGIDEILQNKSKKTSGPILWLYVVGHQSEPWKEILDAARRYTDASREDIIRILYGEDIPTAKIFLGSGRWIIKPEIIPPLLNDDDMHCYWTNGPGIKVTDEMIRRVIYDAVFSRDTHGEARKERYKNIDVIKKYWENSDVIGTGHQEGGFWIFGSDM